MAAYAAPLKRSALGAASGLLVGPACWFVAQQVSTVIAAYSCSRGLHALAIALVNFGLLIICLGGGWPSLQAWRYAGHHAPTGETRRFLGVLGVMAALLFGMALLAQGVADIFFSGCER